MMLYIYAERWTTVKKRIGYLIVIFLLILNMIVLPTSNAKEMNDHWVNSYSVDLEQRLELIKDNTLKDNTLKDTEKKDIEIVIEHVFKSSSYDEYISISNWKRLMKLILQNEKVDTAFIESASRDNHITREDAVVTIMKVLKEKYNLNSTELIILALRNIFNDSANVEQEKSAYITLAVKEGLISGYDDVSFRPTEYLRNSEAITIIEKVCRKYGLPELQSNNDIIISTMDGYMQIDGLGSIDEAFWTNDDGILLVNYLQHLQIREAVKVFVADNGVIKALEYNDDHISERLFNEKAFENERGYISSNKIIWDKMRRYINKDGELKKIYLPYVNYWISGDESKVFIEDEIQRRIKIFDFLTEKEVFIPEYYRWADDKYSRGMYWSPDSKHIISMLFSPEDDIGFSEKNRFAIFNCDDGRLVKLINDYGYYSFYPKWSVDGRKIAYFRVKMDDKEVKEALNHMVDHHFDLPVKEIGIYDLDTGETTYYNHPTSIILGKDEEGIVWSPQGDKLYIETVFDKKQFIDNVEKNNELDFKKVVNEVWELDLKRGEYNKILTGEMLEERETAYSVIKRVCSVSAEGDRILYMNQLYNMNEYENIPPQYIVKNLVTGKELIINENIFADHWWMKKGMVFVEYIPPEYRKIKFTYKIKRLTEDFEIREIASFTQHHTDITISPDKQYLMLHQYRGEKDIKIIKLK